jgi:tRNA (guanine-N7-)-methyltransferase
MKFKRVRKIWSKIKNLNLMNLVVLCGEAKHATKFYFSDQSVTGIYINFPDPWPKKRHAKNRLIDPSFIHELYRILKPQGKITIVTDDFNYSNEIIRLMSQVTGFTSLYAKGYTLNSEDYGTSYFDTLWRTKGKEIRLHEFIKQERVKCE